MSEGRISPPNEENIIDADRYVSSGLLIYLIFKKQSSMAALLLYMRIFAF